MKLDQTLLNMDGSPKDRKGIERGLEAVRDCRPSARPQHNDIQGVEARTLYAFEFRFDDRRTLFAGDRATAL